MSNGLTVRVAAIRQLTPLIRELTLEALPGGELPAFSPGSHVVLELPAAAGALRNAYSLTGSPFDCSHYRIAVRLQEDSRGGSRYLHRQLQAGQVLTISTPSNYFVFEQGAGKLLLIAGGVGITPFVSLLPCLPWNTGQAELHYACRSEQDAAYVDELRQQLGERLHLYASARGQRLEVGRLLAAQTPGAQVYVCGPASLIDAVRGEAAALGWPGVNVHYERFAVNSDGKPFRVALQRSERYIHVEAGESLLEAIERHGIRVPHLCRAGVCGECKTGLLRGDADQRDLFLSDAQKLQGACILPCVSRARGDSELVLDL